MSPTATKVPFAEASPAQIREAILPEDQAVFDEQYAAALDAARATLSLSALDGFLEHWRRIAWAQTAHGHDAWRELLATAERRLAGEPPAGRPWEEVRAELGL